MTAQQKKGLRRFLMVGGVLLVAIAVGIGYAFSGRYMSTDNSYVKANKISVAPEVTGRVVAVTAKDHQAVSKGDVLFTIDPATFRIEVDKSESNLEVVRTQIEELKAEARQKQEELHIAQSDKKFADTLYNRRTGPNMKGAVSEESVDEASHVRAVAEARIAQLQQEYAKIVARLDGNVDIKAEDHPLFRSAQAVLDNARLNLDRTTVRAPAEGITSELPRVGDYMPAGVPAVSVVESKGMWIEANFKETELTNIRPGQKAEVEIDTYPGKKWEGVVTSIAPATGAEFSVLPAQNATGNWLKVGQRLTVRIEPEQNENDPRFRTGMSAEATIDTGS